MFDYKFIFIKRVCTALAALQPEFSSISLSVALVRFSSERMFEPVARVYMVEQTIAFPPTVLRMFGCFGYIDDEYGPNDI